tara:strand:+ start:144 stop:344 length:201 start_codon:yes stop_codon:yes gene_type:complete
MIKAGKVNLKKIYQFNTADDPVLIREHKNLINTLMRKFSLDVYSVLLISTLKGFCLGGLSIWLMMR